MPPHQRCERILEIAERGRFKGHEELLKRELFELMQELKRKESKKIINRIKQAWRKLW